ncbi:MAG TPA: glutaredoxin 3 [Gammaproteobacteria bacterium]
MARIEIYTTGYCGYCRRAKMLLNDKAAEYEEIRVDAEPERRAEMMARSGRRTVPQIFINGAGIGGCDELFALERKGRLDDLLAKE